MITKILIPTLILFAGTIFSLITGKAKKGDISRIIGIVSLLSAIIVIAIIRPFDGEMIFHDLLVVDLYGRFFTYLYLSLGIAIILGSMRILDDKPELVALILIATIGMIFVSISNDLIAIFISWEIMSLATYILTGLKKTPKSTEGAVKYFIYGLVSSALILYAISLVYGLTGSTKINVIYQNLSAIKDSGLYLVGLFAALFIFGFGYKMGIVPFHLWLPDVYEGAHAPVTQFLGGIVKKVAIAAFARVYLQGFLSADINWKLIFAILAVITMTDANIEALGQKNVIRMFAYSSISQMGYILIGFAALTDEGIAGMNLQLLAHAVTSVGIFTAIEYLHERYHLNLLDDYKGLVHKHFGISLSLAVMVLSLGGLPPFIGFISKFLLFSSSVEAGMTWLAVVAVLNSVLSFGYYLPFLKNIFFDSPDILESPKYSMEKSIPEDTQKTTSLHLDWRWNGSVFVILTTAIIVIVLAIFAQPIYNNLLAGARGIL